ncbi:MAG TPA: hypothetical protein VM368_02030, partial [Flavisolibacter sp.]|nr:hypothetical protein [Flavisolibacter sp.]
INNWAYKHPTPWDFFRTIENAAGEDLAWFWRSWVFANHKLDLSVKGVKYTTPSKPDQGATITIQNLEQMALPVPLLIKEANGTSTRLDLPVEIWMRGGEHSFNFYPKSKITEVVIDPDKKLPDVNRKNNNFKGQL